MATLDTSIVNIALPQIAQEFRCSLAQISWVIVVYLLTNASLLLTSGRLGDLLAPGRLYLLGMVIFTSASVLCGMSSGIIWLVASRTLQGMGASLMLALAPKLISLAYSEKERGLALGLFSTAFASGVSVGAPLGGIITTYLGWPFIFFINVPICVLALAVGSLVLLPLKAEKNWDWRALDLGGGVILAASLGLFMLALTWLRDPAQGDWRTLATLGLAAALFVLLLFWEHRQSYPLLHPELWRSWAFILGSMTVLLTFALLMGTFFLLPFFLVEIYHYTAYQTGLLVAVLSVTNALAAPLGGYLADRLSNMLILRLGSGLILLGLISLLFLGPQDSSLVLASRLVILGIGFGMFQAPNLNEILRGVQPSLIGLAASTNSVLKNTGSFLGVALMVTVFAWVNLHQTNLAAEACLGIECFQKGFAAAAGVAVINLAINLLPRQSKKP
jgi:EmrB/QacA subfamily drug resistance transporter